MSANDPYTALNAAEDEILGKIITRLEARESDANFAAWTAVYLEKLPLANAARVLDNGCGTGVVTRALARKAGNSTEIVASDFSPDLIETARRRAAEEGLVTRTRYVVSDAHALDFEDASFDVVIAHTLISHVADPAKVLSEIARVTRPGGSIVIFDGDYTGLSFDHPNPELARTMDAALVQTVFNNPRIMRDLPRLFPDCGLELSEGLVYALVEVGPASYWVSFIEAYSERVAQLGVVAPEQVTAWLQYQRKAIDERRFFGGCNYFTYLARRV